MELTKELEQQAKSADTKVAQNAKDCLTIANKLMELEDGHVWSSQWSVLTSVRWVGKGRDCKRQFEPSKIGRVFLQGIN